MFYRSPCPGPVRNFMFKCGANRSTAEIINIAMYYFYKHSTRPAQKNLPINTEKPSVLSRATAKLYS